MNKKLEMLALVSLFTVSGVIIKDTQVANANPVLSTTVTNQYFANTNSTILSQGYGQPQGSPWGELQETERYTNPDTGQEFCFYSSARSRWAPCPNHGTRAIIPQNAKCIGSSNTQALADRCPRAQCELVRVQASFNALSNNGYSTPALPCNGLP